MSFVRQDRYSTIYKSGFLPDKALTIHGIINKAKVIDRGRKLHKGAYDPIRLQRGYGHVGIAEIYRDNWHAGRARGVHVGRRIPDHDSVLRIPAGAHDGRAEHLRVGLLNAESVLTAYRGETPAQPELLQKAKGEPFELVGAYREPVTGAGESSEHRLDRGEGAGAVCDVFGIMGDESSVKLIHTRRRAVPSFGRQRAFDHASRPAADQRTRGVETHRRQIVTDKRKIERVDQIGGGINKRAVEIEIQSQQGFA
jgi:hypothetical protein